MASWKDLYNSKVITPQQAIKHIRPGARILIGSACSQPSIIIDELIKDTAEIVDSEIYNFYPIGPTPYADEKYSKKFRVCSFFLSDSIKECVNNGRGDYLPISLSEIPQLFKSGKIPLHTVIIQTSAPDRNGNLSLGISVDIVKAAVENSLTVIAEVNSKMPRTLGDAFIPLEMIDAIVESDRPLTEFPEVNHDSTTMAIMKNIAGLIDDGATLGIGIGSLPQAIFRYLNGKKDLGIHSEVVSDDIIPLIDSGVINGRRKGINRGKIIASMACGSHKLYEYLHENPIFDFRPSEYVNDNFIISQNNQMVAIYSATEIDMTGQVCCDSDGFEFTRGIGGAVDFFRGAINSKEGKTIIAIPSKKPNGKGSTIVPKLSDGAGVVLLRSDIHYVVTEYGVADLYGKNIRERVLALAEIAHPDYRNDLLKAAKNHHYIFEHQKELPATSAQYPREYETTRTLVDGTELFFRPIRSTDDKSLRDMFYALSEKSIAFRFFQPIKSFSHKFLQDFTTIDFSKDMAIAACIQDLGGEQIVGVGHYYLNQETKRADVSFLVRDDWQSKGIGTELLNILTDIARKRGVAGFDARVLVQNELMLSLFYNSGLKITTKREDDSYLISYNFKKE